MRCPFWWKLHSNRCTVSSGGSFSTLSPQDGSAQLAVRCTGDGEWIPFHLEGPVLVPFATSASFISHVEYPMLSIPIRSFARAMMVTREAIVGLATSISWVSPSVSGDTSHFGLDVVGWQVCQLCPSCVVKLRMMYAISGTPLTAMRRAAQLASQGIRPRWMISKVSTQRCRSFVIPTVSSMSYKNV